MNDLQKNTGTVGQNLNDIIERKGKNLEAIFDAVPVGLLLVDEDMTVIRVNRVIHKMVNMDYADIINKPLGVALNCKSLAIEKKGCTNGKHCSSCPLTTNIKAVFNSAEPVQDFEFQSHTHFVQNGREPWFAMNIKLTNIDDKQYAVVCLMDITEKRLAEEKLRETMEMKTQFISTVSHELRTPLASIKEALNIVIEGLAGRVKKKQKPFLEIARRNVHRLGLLINDVLDFQKLDSGRMQFNLERYDVASVIKEAADTMQLMADKQKVRLNVELEENLGTAIFDNHRIMQVLTNLLSNAIKFTPENGSVLLRTGSQDDEIVIVVSDTGMGIPKNDLPKIFERFYRVNRPGKEIKGTGLGLPIVAQIVSHHNGRIFVDSQQNKGTTFTVYIPKQPVNIEQIDEKIEETLS